MDERFLDATLRLARGDGDELAVMVAPFADRGDVQLRPRAYAGGVRDGDDVVCCVGDVDEPRAAAGDGVGDFDVRWEYISI